MSLSSKPLYKVESQRCGFSATWQRWQRYVAFICINMSQTFVVVANLTHSDEFIESIVIIIWSFRIQTVGGVVRFTVEVSQSQRDNVKTSSKVRIVALTNIEAHVNRFKAIYQAEKCALFEGIIVPAKLSGFTQQIVDCAFGIKHQSGVSSTWL